jgi:rod shape-determining protein MreD
MEHLKITISLIIAVLLQWTLRNIAEPLQYIDFPLIIVVYAALQRNSINALLMATFSGIAIDALSGSLMGANGFSKTLVIYLVIELSRRVYLDNILLRIPIIAGACLLEDIIFFGVQQLLGHQPVAPVIITIGYTLIGTTIIGTLIFFFLDSFYSSALKAKKREFFAARRQTHRRNPIRLGRRG